MAKTHKVAFKLNGKDVAVEAEARELLIYTLREKLAHTGPHIGCETTHCGACTVDVDGMSVAPQHSAVRRFAVGYGRRPRARRRAACAAAGFPRGARPAMRVLHARHADPRLSAAAREPESDGAGHPLRYRRQPVPMHRLSEHRQGGPVRRPETGSGACSSGLTRRAPDRTQRPLSHRT